MVITLVFARLSAFFLRLYFIFWCTLGVCVGGVGAAQSSRKVVKLSEEQFLFNVR